MAIIKPTRKFEGSDSDISLFGKIIKDGVKVINMRDEKNKQGRFFYLLPPYKLDSQGNGVSWKSIKVRTNFGVDIQERFPESEDSPLKYFENQVKLYFPEYAKVEKQVKNGKEIKKYPTYGRVQRQMLFNFAYFEEPQLGAYVFNCPSFGAGQVIEEWGRTRGIDGQERPLLNNPEAAYPIWAQLKKDCVGFPWVINIESSKPYILPAELCDSDNLWNLDEVLYFPDNDEIIEKLRCITPSDIFEKCISGYYPKGGIKPVYGGYESAKNDDTEVDSVSTLQTQRTSPVIPTLPPLPRDIPSAVDKKPLTREEIMKKLKEHAVK